MGFGGQGTYDRPTGSGGNKWLEAGSNKRPAAQTRVEITGFIPYIAESKAS